MAVGIQNYENVDAPDSDYPNGKIRDDDGTGNGTEVDKRTYGDVHQFLAKLLRKAGITANGFPENEYIGHQYFNALKTIIGTADDVTDDLNNISLSGLFYAAGAANRPPGESNGYVISIVLDVTQYKKQYFSAYNSDAVWIRRLETGVWQTWAQIANMSDVAALGATKANVAQNAWIGLAFSAPWVNQNTSAQYRINSLGKIELRGQVWTSGTNLTSFNLLIATLPVEARPSRDHIFTAQYFNGTTRLINELTIGADGKITLGSFTASAPASDVNLDGCSFWTD